MRLFVIADGSKRKAKPVATLLWEPDAVGGDGVFTLEVSSHVSEDDLPLSLSFCARRAGRRATPAESEEWVRSRIVPENRQNIAEVLSANGLVDYDVVGLLSACKGRSSDDDLLAYEVILPEGALVALAAEGSCAPGEGASRDGAPRAGEGCASRDGTSRADVLISAVERQGAAGEVHYAYVGLWDGEDAAARPRGSHPSAQQVAAQIRQRRRDAGLTQKQLAARAGITQTVLSRLESGAGNPTLALLEDVAAALDARLEVSLL